MRKVHAAFVVQRTFEQLDRQFTDLVVHQQQGVEFWMLQGSGRNIGQVGIA
ncbi:hypothetical protein D3C80_2180760 [compost metagenome]